MQLRLLLVALLACQAGCEDRPPPAPDFSGEITFDLGPPIDLPAPYGLDGNLLPVPDPSATFVFSVTDESGAPLPSKVVFRPPPGEGFGDSLTDPLTPESPTDGQLHGATVSPGVVGIPSGVLLQSGWGKVRVPPGRYKLAFSRGPEYEISELELELDDGVEQAVNVELHRSVDTRGWLAADMHVHAGNSFDSKLPLDRRVISLVTSGVEVLVATEHHGTFSYGDLVSDLGYDGERAVALAGNELNFKNGHAGVYPLDPDPTRPRGGSPEYQNLDPGTGTCDEPVYGTNCLEGQQAFAVMHQLRKRGTIVTLNHGWFGGNDLGYFTNIGWGAGTNGAYPAPLDLAGSFDAMEVLNGYINYAEAASYLFADWIALLSAGHKITALGNSDTHNVKWVYAGAPRTLLRFPTDRPGDVDGDALYDAIIHQRAIASNGPFVDLTVNDGRIGDTVVPREGSRAVVHIVADAPMWMSLDDVILFKNGHELSRFSASTDRRPRLDMTYIDHVDGDAYYVALATGHTPLPEDLAGEQSGLERQDVLPIAFTNPVYVDHGGDGVLVFTPKPGPRLPWQPSPKPSHQALHRGAPTGHEHPPLDAMSELLPLLY
jgi:hypothetical protein